MTDLELVKACAEKVLDRDARSVRLIGRRFESHDRSGWNPLESDDDAFQMVDTLYAKGFYCKLAGPRGSWKTWTCSIDDGKELLWVTHHLERRMAIVLACLNAVGVNTE